MGCVHSSLSPHVGMSWTDTSTRGSGEGLRERPVAARCRRSHKAAESFPSRARGFPHAWGRAALPLAPLRAFLQAAGEREAEHEEGAASLSTPRRWAAKALAELPNPARLWLLLQLLHFPGPCRARSRSHPVGMRPCAVPGGAGCGPAWDSRDPGRGGGPGLVAREFTPVSALVPFHGSTLGLGCFRFFLRKSIPSAPV